MTFRTFAKAHAAQRDDIGNLITRRPLPQAGLEQVDPFLFLNHHGPQIYQPGNSGLPFGPHPHRGFETVTFILAGNLAHHDTGGHESVIEEGGVQWMTAGSGLVHAEVSPPSFKERGGPLEILQLWVNLPSRLKMTTPAYTGLQAETIPRLRVANGRGALRLTSGTYDGIAGPVRSLTDVFMATVTLSAGARIDLPAPRGRSVLLYVVRGSVEVGRVPVEGWHLATVNDDGDAIRVEAATDATLLFGHADPIGEPDRSAPSVVFVDGSYRAGRFDQLAAIIGRLRPGRS